MSGVGVTTLNILCILPKTLINQSDTMLTIGMLCNALFLTVDYRADSYV